MSKGTVNDWEMPDGASFKVVQVYDDDGKTVKDEVVTLAVSVDTDAGRLTVDTFSAWGRWESVDTDFRIASCILPVEIWIHLHEDTVRVVSGDMQLPSPNEFETSTEWIKDIGKRIYTDVYEQTQRGVEDYYQIELTYETRKLLYDNLVLQFRLTEAACKFFEFHPPAEPEPVNSAKVYEFKPKKK